MAFMLFSFALLAAVTSHGPVSAQKLKVAASPPGNETAQDDTKQNANDDDDDDDDDDDKFKQPVRAGDLIGRDVIAPVESQNLLGHVRKIVKDTDGDITIVMDHGGLAGIDARLVCVSADDLALTGYVLQAEGISPAEIDRLPNCDGAGDRPIPLDTMLKMQIAKPSH